MNSNEFYAVFVESSYHIPGDERSRTNPGHGYPAHDVTYTAVETFGDEDELKDWIRKNESLAFSKKEYRAVKCTPLSVTTSLDVKVKIDE